MEMLRVKWHFDNCFTVESLGRRGVGDLLASTAIFKLTNTLMGAFTSSQFRVKPAVALYSFQDLQVRGPAYTWSRGNGQNLILERPDRGLATEAWLKKFPHSVEMHLQVSSSDHLALLFKFGDREIPLKAKRRCFKFENLWLFRPNCENVIKESWVHMDSPSAATLTASIHTCGQALFCWNRDVVGHLQTKICLKEKEIEGLVNGAKVSQNLEAIQKIRLELSTLLHSEEVLWRQRAKCNWIKEGDYNTRFDESLLAGLRNRVLVDDRRFLEADFTLDEILVIQNLDPFQSNQPFSSQEDSRAKGALMLVKGRQFGALSGLQRNSCFHDSICKHPKSIAESAKRCLEDFLIIHFSGAREPVTNFVVSWTPPPCDTWKVNVDASFDDRRSITTLGAVVRDSHGVVYVCAAKRVHHVTSALQAELLAILYGTDLSSRFALNFILAESDSLVVVREIGKMDNTLCQWGGLVKSINAQASLFDCLSFVC
ncbi:hypothetical protein DITRI_Ditri09bG0059900 [Diplodiscus trichospermus]